MRRRIHARVKLWVSLICAAAAAGIPAGCNRNANQGSDQAVAVTVQDTAPGHLVGGAAYSANIQPHTQVSLAFQVNGYVQTITQVRGADGNMRDIQGGDVVKAGQVMAGVQENTYQQALNNAQSQNGNFFGILNVHSGVGRVRFLGERCSGWGVVKIADFFGCGCFLPFRIGFLKDFFESGGWHL